MSLVALDLRRHAARHDARRRYPAGGDEESLASAVDDLFTVRSNRSLIDPEDVLARLRQAGFSDTWEAEWDWDTPLRLVIGRRG